jgi:hypothetical protein
VIVGAEAGPDPLDEQGTRWFRQCSVIHECMASSQHDWLILAVIVHEPKAAIIPAKQLDDRLQCLL